MTFLTIKGTSDWDITQVRGISFPLSETHEEKEKRDIKVETGGYKETQKEIFQM